MINDYSNAHIQSTKDEYYELKKEGNSSQEACELLSSIYDLPLEVMIEITKDMR